MSASLPMGSKNAAAPKRYAVAIQLKRIASILKCLPIVGSAKLTDEPINGVRNALSVATISTLFLVEVLSMFVMLNVKRQGTVLSSQNCF